MVARAAEIARRRPWHAGAAAVAAGLALAASPASVTLGLAGLLAVALAAAGARALAPVAALLVICAAAAGQLRLEALDRPGAMVSDAAQVRLRAELLTPPRPSAFGASADVRVTSGPLRGARLVMRSSRWAPLPSGFGIGAELAAEGRLRAVAPHPTEPHAGRAAADAESFDFAAYLRRRGVAGELFVDELRATGARRGGVAGLLDRLRERAEGGLTAGLSSHDAALARGMVLGQDEQIDAGTRDDFRDSGLAHLLAVSGQNVMLLVALVVPMLALAEFGRRARAVALLGLVALYVPLAGAGPSLQRAGVMGAAGIAALVMSRPASRWYALLLAAAVTLALNPRAWQDPGWQLSFAAVAGILTIGLPLGAALRRALDALSPPRRAASVSTEDAPAGRLRAALAPLRRSLMRGLAEGAAITVAATLATAPLLAYHFDSVPLAGLPANLLALPAVAPAMWLGMVKGGLGILSPAIPLAGDVAELLGPAAQVPVAYLTGLAERFADLPGARLELPIRSAGAIAVAYAAIAAAALAVRRLARRAADSWQLLAAGWRRSRLRSAAYAAAAAFLVLAGAALLAPPGPPGAPTVTFLDVGQGDATLVQHPDGSAVLFDGGPPEAATVRLLRRAGVRRLSAVVATHASRDHHGGLGAVLASYPVDLLLDGGDGSRDTSFRALLAEAKRRGIRRVRAVAPVRLQIGGITIRVLSPPARPPGPPPEDPNPRAVVAVVSIGGFDLLLSADAESPSLLPLELPDVDAMKVPHHGSADPGLPELLERVQPEVAAVPVGQNTYGHPAPSTLRALDGAGVSTYRTDRDGTIALTADRSEIEVETER